MVSAATHFVGIDVGKYELVVAIEPEGRTVTVRNTAQGWRQLIQQVPPASCIVLEATGRYHRGVTRALDRAGLAPAVINPARIHAFRRSEGRAAKTDGLDAALLARFADQKRPAPAVLPSPARVQLAEWVRYRDFLVAQCVAVRNRRQEVPPALRREHDQLRRVLTKQIARVETQLAQVIAGDAELARQFALLDSVPGIDLVTGATLLAHLPELGRLTGKPLASLAGVAPRDDQSGTRRGQSRVHGGRARVREALYLMAVTTSRHDPVIRAHYQQLLTRGKAKKVALLACARRVLGILNAMVREDLTWQQTKVGQGQFLPSPP